MLLPNDFNFPTSADEFKIPEVVDKLNFFISTFQSDKDLGKKIVLISSGGTTVALESRTVRYLDNFSSGTRGSVSAEWFLRNNYYVIFLHRRGSLMPFQRKIDCKDFLNDFSLDNNSGKITLNDTFVHRYSDIIIDYHKYKTKLLYLDFITIQEYLAKLECICKILRPLNNMAMLYLAAAVSDFFIPKEDLSEHKIQSSDGPLNLKLQMVPKMLGPLTCKWIPKAFILSFKLETDPNILERKCLEALQKYRHQVVIGNIIDTRKKKVWISTLNDEKFEFKPLSLNDSSDKEIEELLVNILCDMHNSFMRK